MTKHSTTSIRRADAVNTCTGAKTNSTVNNDSLFLHSPHTMSSYSGACIPTPTLSNGFTYLGWQHSGPFRKQGAQHGKTAHTHKYSSGRSFALCRERLRPAMAKAHVQWVGGAVRVMRVCACVFWKRVASSFHTRAARTYLDAEPTNKSERAYDRP